MATHMSGRSDHPARMSLSGKWAAIIGLLCVTARAIDFQISSPASGFNALSASQIDVTAIIANAVQCLTQGSQLPVAMAPASFYSTAVGGLAPIFLVRKSVTTGNYTIYSPDTRGILIAEFAGTSTSITVKFKTTSAWNYGELVGY